MPHCLSHKEGVLYIALSGTITEADLEKLGTEVLEVEAASPVTPHRITDLTMVTGMEIDFSSILSLARRRMETTVTNPIKSAIVATELAHIGFARMFQTVNRHPHIAIKIFPDADAALAWIVAS